MGVQGLPSLLSLQNSPNNISGISNPPGTPRDDGELGGNFLHSFQNDNVSACQHPHFIPGPPSPDPLKSGDSFTNFRVSWPIPARWAGVLAAVSWGCHWVIFPHSAEPSLPSLLHGLDHCHLNPTTGRSFWRQNSESDHWHNSSGTNSANVAGKTLGWDSGGLVIVPWGPFPSLLGRKVHVYSDFLGTQ